MTNRAPRVQRDDEVREVEYTWKPAASLPDIKQLPGYKYRWVRTSMVGVEDGMNVSARTREGWEIVDPKEQPHLKMFAKEGQLEVGGLILCKMPEEMVAARQRYYNNQASQQMKTVDNHFMRDNDRRMPLFNERRSEVTFGQGTQ